MGDRTWVRITFAKSDEKTVLDAFGWPTGNTDCLDLQEERGVAIACLDEINWGGIEEMRALAKKGVTFTAHAGAGGSYGESLSVGHRGEFIEVSACEGDPVCLVRDIGKADAEGMMHIRTYLRLARKANREIERTREKHREAA